MTAGRRDALRGFESLYRLQTAEERVSTWRECMATLAAAVMDQEPVPLEGLDPDALLSSVRLALNTGLVDDLDWLSKPAAATALYELASSVPVGVERRDLGRRVFIRLHEGNASTFVALATSLAVGSSKALEGGAVRARVALSLQLPLGSSSRSDALALALISRPELEQRWLSIPSTGSLPSRRLAARLLERAAREAARRASAGDQGVLQTFSNPFVLEAWSRLLGDRESLVWRHVASARGILSAVIPSFEQEIERDLMPRLTPTEWRRGAASLTASLAVRSNDVKARCLSLLKSDILHRDRGVAGAMVFGLAHAAQAEPEISGPLLSQLAEVGGTDVAEALIDTRNEWTSAEFAEPAIHRAKERLEQTAVASEDMGQAALADCLFRELSMSSTQDVKEADVSLQTRLIQGLRAFEERSAKEAIAAAHQALQRAEATASKLDGLGTDDSGSYLAFGLLRDLDSGLLERSTLSDLLALSVRQEAAERHSPVEHLFSRLHHWFIQREAKHPSQESLRHKTLHLRRLRTFLHLVDADGSGFPSGDADLRKRRLTAMRLLLNRLRTGSAPFLERTLCAALARAWDAMVREEICEMSDVLIVSARHLTSPNLLRIVGEASMVPEIKTSLRGYADMWDTAERRPAKGESVDSLLAFARELPPSSGPRVEALRATVLLLGLALNRLLSCHSLKSIAGSQDPTPLTSLQRTAVSLSRLVVGARRRMESGFVAPEPSIGAAVQWLDMAVDRARRGSADSLPDAVESLVTSMKEELLPAFVSVAANVLQAVPDLPPESKRRSLPASHRPSTVERSLPAWLPPNRALGGYYVSHALGTGAGGTVFAARRFEDRHNLAAEQFALKVPEYDGTVARTLSEAEFLQMFREEASALLSLPQHSNLAGFVTFDAGVRPKPILVMEFVAGPTLEHQIHRGGMTMPQALHFLDGLGAGLCAMHAVGIAHLDVKPSNVILRESGGSERHAVLVDFGLAGRKLRPGCATGPYGAPEVWGLDLPGWDPTPLSADVYAFACVAFEALTGRPLFDESSQLATIAAHLQHDGMPKALEDLSATRALRPLVEVLSTALRRDPRARASIGQVRASLRELSPSLSAMAWPVTSVAPASVVQAQIG